MNKEEQYHVEWLDLSQIAKVSFIPESAKEGLLSFLSEPDQPTFFLNNTAKRDV